MIDCVGILTNHHFPGNLIAEQHKLRYREVIEKEKWRNIYVMGEGDKGVEFDRYDNVSTEYFIKRDVLGRVLGVMRMHPTTIPYMLTDHFQFLATGKLPNDPQVQEASRLVLDRTLLRTREERKPVVHELVLALMERGMQRQIKNFVGFMLPKIWSSTFIASGWDVDWLGPESNLPEYGDVVRAGKMSVNEEMMDKIKRTTGIAGSILNFGSGNGVVLPTAYYSHMERRNEI